MSNQKFRLTKKRKEILQKYWDQRTKAKRNFRQTERKIEEELSMALGTKVPLIFWYCDSECQGIGAVLLQDRKYFPLWEPSH